MEYKIVLMTLTHTEELLNDYAKNGWRLHTIQFLGGCDIWITLEREAIKIERKEG